MLNVFICWRLVVGLIVDVDDFFEFENLSVW